MDKNVSFKSEIQKQEFCGFYRKENDQEIQSRIENLSLSILSKLAFIIEAK